MDFRGFSNDFQSSSITARLRCRPRTSVYTEVFGGLVDVGSLSLRLEIYKGIIYIFMDFIPRPSYWILDLGCLRPHSIRETSDKSEKKEGTFVVPRIWFVLANIICFHPSQLADSFGMGSAPQAIITIPPFLSFFLIHWGDCASLVLTDASGSQIHHRRQPAARAMRYKPWCTPTAPSFRRTRACHLVPFSSFLGIQRWDFRWMVDQIDGWYG